MAETFPSLNRHGRVNLNVDIYVDATAGAQPVWSVPQFRGRDHLVFADYGPNDCMLADLRAAHVIGRFSPSTAQNGKYWKRVVLPILLGVAGPVAGVTALHCACLHYKGEGLLITGESGAGKSTLAFELTRRGLDFISDDWTYFSPAAAEVLAWGLPTNIKLLPDSVAHFPELNRYVPGIHLNGELALEVDPEELGAKRSLSTRPGRIFVLDRKPGLGFEVSRLAAREIFAYFQQSLEKLPACLMENREAQLATIRALSRAECWHVRCGGTPQEIATRMLQFCDHVSPRPSVTASPLRLTRREWPDMLRRFVTLPLVRLFSSGGYSFQVATDSEQVMRALRRITKPATISSPPAISWTIQEERRWPVSLAPASGLTSGGLSFLTVGQHAFVACDGHAGRAMSFIAATNSDRELEPVLRTMLSHLLHESATSTLPISSPPAQAAQSDVPAS
ncbi:MAG TPA: hypothetical protein VGR48_10580 [Terriglobales bacterium]|nr:hypothetical protein [Terriglobales bacterium]